MNGNDFNPMQAFRAVAQDESLNATQKAILWATIYYTDNRTATAKVSYGMIAAAAGCYGETVGRFVRSDAGRRWLQTKRIGLQVDLVWQPAPPTAEVTALEAETALEAVTGTEAPSEGDRHRSGESPAEKRQVTALEAVSDRHRSVPNYDSSTTSLRSSTAQAPTPWDDDEPSVWERARAQRAAEGC